MTPKEKAQELVIAFIQYADGTNIDYEFSLKVEEENSKKCALLTVDELIKETGSKYWYEVKSEIEKL